MKIELFRYLRTDSPHDDRYPHWSRKYEYPTVLNEILKRKSEFVTPTVHNSSWGFDEEHHQKFKNSLEAEFGVVNVTNSDIIYRQIPNTCYHNITEPPNENFREKFDFVLNVSALEEIPGDHDQYLRNLYDQVKPGGYLICTFDYPGLRLSNLDNILDNSDYENRLFRDTTGWINVGEISVLLFVAKKENE